MHRTTLQSARTAVWRHFRFPVLVLSCAVLLSLSATVVAAAGVERATVRKDPSKKEVPADSAGFDPEKLARVDSVLRRAVAEGATPGAALVVGRHGKLVRLRGYGRTDWQLDAPEVTDSTLYDLASLTKAMGTATVAAQLVRERKLKLDQPIHRYLPGWPRTGRHGLITVRHLLAHTSGLPAGADLWHRSGTRRQRVDAIARMKVRTIPGKRREYSDLGMIVLGAVLEQVTGSRLDELLQVRVFRPLAMSDTRFNPLRSRNESGAFALTQIAPTEFDPKRGGHVHGVVHDLNAWALDGIAGHAGLFSSARDMAAYGQAILEAARGNPTPLFPGGSFLAFISRERSFGRPLGWDVPTSASSPAGRYFSKASIGHTGFTGTSIWVDPERDVFVVLLTNRLNPSAHNTRHVKLRREVHDLVQLAISDMSVTPRD